MLSFPIFADENGTGSVSDAASFGSFKAQGYAWLEEETMETIGPVFDQSLAILALTNGGRDVSPLVSRLLEQQHPTEGCWPNPDCTVKDTALASLALSKVQQREKALEGEAWLRKSLVPGLKRGEWQVQIKSGESGTCHVAVNNNSARPFEIEDDKIKQARGEYYIRNNEIDPGLTNKVSPLVKVDCSELPGTANPVIALLYRATPTNLYLLESHSAFSADLLISNSCFAKSVSSPSCSDEDSLYANWALAEIFGSDVSKEFGSLTYLQTKIKPSMSAGDLALINRALQEASRSNNYYLGLLADQQKADGSWGDAYSSSLALLALRPSAVEYGESISLGDAFLERSFDKESGSWSQDVRVTSMALLALEGSFTSGFVDLSSISSRPSSSTELVCDDATDDDGDGFIDCGDTDCKFDGACLCSNGVQDADEEGVDCGGSCSNLCAGDVVEESFDDSDEGDDVECSSDFDCSEGEECFSGSCLASAVDEEGGSLWWLWLLIILLALGGGGYFVYVKYVKTGKLKFGKSKKKGQSFDDFKMQYKRPVAQNPVNQRPAMTPVVRNPASKPLKKSKGDLELEKSLREAEKILKGK